MRSGRLIGHTEDEPAYRQAHLQQAEVDFDPPPFDAAATPAFDSLLH